MVRRTGEIGVVNRIKVRCGQLRADSGLRRILIMHSGLATELKFSSRFFVIYFDWQGKAPHWPVAGDEEHLEKDSMMDIMCTTTRGELCVLNAWIYATDTIAAGVEIMREPSAGSKMTKMRNTRAAPPAGLHLLSPCILPFAASGC